METSRVLLVDDSRVVRKIVATEGAAVNPGDVLAVVE